MIRINAQKLQDDPDYRALVEYIRTAELGTGSPPAEHEQPNSWLQSKNAAQRKALKALNERVYNQRLQLRLTNETGRGLSKEEWLAAKEVYPRLDADLLVS